jgi:hypothetical protein
VKCCAASLFREGLAVPRKYVTCPKCAHRNDRAGGRRKCAGCSAPLPKRRVQEHAKTLRADSYAVYVEVNEQIHGAGEDCGCCNKPRVFPNKHERDHGHKRSELSYGRPRGLACTYCNKTVLGSLSLEEHRAAVAYLERVESFYERQAVA